MQTQIKTHTPGPWFVEQFTQNGFMYVSQQREDEVDTIAQVYTYVEEGNGAVNAALIATAPEMRDSVETLRALLLKFVSGTANVHDDGAIQDAIARSGFLLARSQGKDVTAAVAAYEASLLEIFDEDDADDSDFGRYGGSHD